MRMIEPPPPTIIQGEAARLRRKEPVRLTASTRSHAARLVSRIVPPGSCGAAPLTRISSLPKASCAAVVTVVVSASTETSQRRAIARPPAVLTRRAVSSTKATSISQEPTAAPASAKASEIARPIPPPAPLTSATFPVSIVICLCLPSEHDRAAVDRDGLAGHKAARIRHKPNHRTDKVGWGQVALDRLPALYHVECAVDALAEEFARAVGQDRARRQSVDPDAIASELTGQPAGQSDHGRLRGRIMQSERHAVGGGERGEIDDTAAPGLPHRRHYRLATVPDALDIHRHRGVPIRLRDRIEAATLERAIKRGVIDQRVDTPELTDRCRDRVARGCGISDVDPDGEGLPVLRVYEFECRRAIVDVGCNDGGACGSQASRELLPDTARRTRDDNNLIVNR